MSIANSITMRVSVIFFLFFAFVNAFASFEIDVPESTRIVVVGDIHGDIDGLTKILSGMNLITQNGKWKGGKAILVTLGDLINKGDYGREVMDLLIDLESDAEKAGGRVISTLANYELIATLGGDRNLTEEDIESYSSYAEASDRSEFAAYVRAFKGNTKYAKWIRSRPALLRINDTLFTHGSLTMRMRDKSLSQMNEMIKKWFEFYQGVGTKPDLRTRWSIAGSGPLWSRAIEPGADVLDEDELNALLKHFRANRLVVGHTVVKKLRETLYHDDFDGRVYMMETGNSYAMGGKLSAAVIQDGYISSFRIKRGSGEVIFKRKRKLITQGCENLLGT